MAPYDPASPSIHLIGISGYARAILRSLGEAMETAGGRLASATVINRREEETACRTLEGQGCHIHSDYQTMLGNMGPGKNLCIIPTSIYLHAQMTIDAVNAGADVLVEKPLAGSAEEAREMIKAGLAAGRTISVGYQDMYAPQVAEIKKSLISGAIGALHTITVTASWPRNLSYYSRNRWAGRASCNGRPVFDSPINNAFAHFVNLALFFAGPTRHGNASVTAASGRLFRFFPIETFDTVQVMLETSAGCEIRCILTHAAEEKWEPRITIEGETGTLTWRQEDQAILRGPCGRILQGWRLDSEETNRRRMLERVIISTRDGTPSPCPASLAVSHVEAVREVVRSLAVEDGAKAFGLDRPEGNWTPVQGLMTQLEEGLLISLP